MASVAVAAECRQRLDCYQAPSQVLHQRPDSLGVVIVLDDVLPRLSGAAAG
jgi:hypothetical protein